MAIYSTERLSEMVATLNVFASKSTAKAEKMNRRINDICPKETRKYFQLMREDAKFLHGAFRSLYIKQAVLTELRFFLRDDPQLQGKAVAALVRAFDFDDQWWLKNQALVMGDWLKVALELAELEQGERNGGF